MALNRSFRQIRDHIDNAKTWEAEKRLVAGRAVLAAERRQKLQDDIVAAEAKRQVREEGRKAYVDKQRAAGMAECPICDRWWPYSELDAHIRGCDTWPQGS